MGSLASTPALPPVDYSKPRTFDLSRQRPNKTIDVGANGTTVSADPFGTILQLSTYHPEHGIAVAAPYEQFDGSRYRDPSYVRQYRSRMLQMIDKGQSGFGLRLVGATRPSTVSIQHRAMDAADIFFTHGAQTNVCCTIEVHPSGEITQTMAMTNVSDQTATIEYVLDLGLSVHRASYGQLTEGGPIPLPRCENDLKKDIYGTSVSVVNKYLDACLQSSVEVHGKLITLEGVADYVTDGPLSTTTNAQAIDLHPGGTANVTARFFLYPGTETTSQPPQLSPSRAGAWKETRTAKSYVVRRNVDYILGTCCLPVPDMDVAIITDHVALPLGWNRDNYWQWRLLLEARRQIDTIVTETSRDKYLSGINRVLKGHLSWVYRRAQRPHGFWHRSYIVTGKPKDGPVFQLDQQCYPLLELCDYMDEFTSDGDFIRDIVSGGVIGEIVRLLQTKRDPTTGLFSTDETPGDDTVDLPFHFSSHVLLWYTLTRTTQLLKKYGSGDISPEHIQSLADATRQTTLSHFVRNKGTPTGTPMLAYLVDGGEQRTFYHDANDIPTVLAVKWNFLSSTEEIAAWRNTMVFASSKTNELGFSSGGPFAGLGSVHSPGPWPLGYFQELLFAHLTGNTESKTQVAEKIIGAMQWDGTFGEAVDVVTGSTTSKAWFCWPGSMLGAALLEEGIEL